MASKVDKGIYIPEEVLHDDSLSPTDKIVMGAINLKCREIYCFETNAELAEFAGCGERTVSKSINKLIEEKYIRVEHFDGRTRVLRHLSKGW